METLQPIFQFLHSWARWIFLVAAVVALGYFALGWLQKRVWDRRAQLIQTVFTIMMDVQWLLGLLLFIVWGAMTGLGFRYRWEHLFMQTVALVVAHLPMIWRKKELPDATRYQRALLVVVAVLVLIIVGIFTLPGAIQWRFYLPG